MSSEALYQQMEEKIRASSWWSTAATCADPHYSNRNGIMLTDHLEAVYDNVDQLFKQLRTGFYGDMFQLIGQLDVTLDHIAAELKLVALLHDIGKPAEDKGLVIPHPLTGKPAHKRHGLVALMAAMELFGEDTSLDTTARMRIYRTVELHDISYGLFREFKETGDMPDVEKWHYIHNKVDPHTGAGLYYLLLFKLADTHGHLNLRDVIWFYETVAAQYFVPEGLILPIPTETDIRSLL